MPGEDPVRRGNAALAVGDWASAKERFTDAVEESCSAEALDGLGRAQRWLKDVRGAVETRTRAHSAFKRDGRYREAALVAVWLSRELRPLLRSGAAADGWLARAETLAARTGDASLPGWISLARAEATSDVTDAVACCRFAVESARERDDPDLEIQALARLGVLQVAAGAVEEGITRLDEAMAAVSAGEALDLVSVGMVFCALMELAELLGDNTRFAEWTAALTEIGGTQGFGPLDGFGADAGYGALSSFCGACCGGLYLITGRMDEAEGELLAAVRDLESHDMGFRCVHPITQLAELRVLQGRFEEARDLLASYEDLPEAVRPLAVLDLAIGSPAAAAARLERRIDELGRLTVTAFPLLTVLVDAQLSLGQPETAARSVSRMAEVAAITRSRRHGAEVLLARGKIAALEQREEAAPLLREAAKAFGEASIALQACRARLALSRALAHRDRAVAITEARAALAAFERLGVAPDADSAAAFLRELGVRGRTGPKNLELLSKREVEVLRLVANGLSNAEIASRLFISVKTAGNHVSSVLSKLGLRSRTEAAAFAAIHLRGSQSENREVSPSFVPPSGAR